MITIIIGNPFPSLFEDYFFLFNSTQLLFVSAIKFGLETFKNCVIRICADKRKSASKFIFMLQQKTD